MSYLYLSHMLREQMSWSPTGSCCCVIAGNIDQGRISLPTVGKAQHRQATSIARFFAYMSYNLQASESIFLVNTRIPLLVSNS